MSPLSRLSPRFEPSAIETCCQEFFPQCEIFLRDLVALNSYSKNPTGVRANADRIVAQFALLGFRPTYVPCETPGTGEHLILERDAEGPTVLMISHLDTVYTPEEQAVGYAGWMPNGQTTYGPGTMDIKGGTALMWLTLKALSECDPATFARTRWVLAWNAAEELLNAHFAQVCLSYIKNREAYGLVFESDNQSSEGFAILAERNGQARYHLTVRGRGAHAAGKGFENGINAITQISSLITRIAGLANHARNVTTNVGIVQGGQATNRVPDLAEAWFEIRYADPADYRAIRESLQSLNGPGDLAAVSDGVRSEISFVIESEIDPWVKTPDSERLAQHWRTAGQLAGHPLTVTRRGGLSDANFLAAHLPLLDGLGPRGGNAHGIERTGDDTRIIEYVDLESFVPKAVINVLGLCSLLGSPSSAVDQSAV